MAKGKKKINNPVIVVTKEKKNISFEKKVASSIHWQALILFAFAFILYAQTLSYEYVLDDGLMITENRFTRKGFDGIWDIMSNDLFTSITGEKNNAYFSGGRYRPISQVVFAIEWELFGNNPLIGHLVNVLFYSFLSALIFLVLVSIMPRAPDTPWYMSFPFVCTVLFIAHPIHTEVVANIKSLDEILAMLCGIAVLYITLKYIKTKQVWLLLLSGIIFLIGVLSKENAITFFAIVPLVLFVFKKSTIQENVIVLIPLVLATLSYLAIRYSIYGFITSHVESQEYNHNPFMFATTSQRYATVVYTWWKYLQLLILPVNLTHDYYPKQVPIINWLDVRAILPLLLYVGLFIYSIIAILKKHIVAFGVLFFLITFSVVSNIVFDLGLFMNERFMFTSSLGFVIVVAWVVFKVFEKQSKQIVLYMFIGIVFLYSLKTFSRSMAWHDGNSLFYTDVHTSTNSGRCNVIAGVLLVEEGKKEKDTLVKNKKYREAVPFLIKGLELNDRNPGGWGILGEVYIYLGELDKSEQTYTSFLRKYPNNENALGNLSYLSSAYADSGRFDKSIEITRLQMKQQPNKPQYIFQYAELFNKMNKRDTMMRILLSLVSKFPQYIEPYNRLAEFYGMYYNNIDKSIYYLEKAYAINTGNSATLENLGVAYGIKGDLKKSLSFFEKALVVSPKKAQLYQNISKTYMIMGDKKKADEFLQKASLLN